MLDLIRNSFVTAKFIINELVFIDNSVRNIHLVLIAQHY